MTLPDAAPEPSPLPGDDLEREWLLAARASADPWERERWGVDPVDEERDDV